MRSKKADLMHEAMNILVALIVIIGLVYLATQLYSIFQNKQNRDRALVQLNEIVAKVNKLKLDGGELVHVYLNPKDWALVYYNINEINVNPSLKNIPAACNFKSCLCICPEFEENDDRYTKEKADICQSQKICKNVDVKINLVKSDNSPSGALIFEKENSPPKSIKMALINKEVYVKIV